MVDPLIEPKLPDAPDSLPGCLGLEKPLFPNKCAACPFSKLCKYIQGNFVPKQNELEFLNSLQKIIHEKQDSASQYDKKNEKEVRR
jgi:hypothetical protein